MLKRIFGNRRRIARIEVIGPIDSKMRQKVLKSLKDIEKEEFPALVLRIDSPGGTVADSQEIHQALKHLQSKGIKVLASFGNISASGGIYIAMGAEKIVSNPGTITGSIGVIIRGNNIEKLLEKVGISFKVIKSGPYKDILSFDRELSAEEQSILQELIDITYSQFVQTVAEARHLTINGVKTFADGRIFSGEQALAMGIVDRLGSEEDTRLWAAELAGLDPDTKFVDIMPKSGPFSRFLPAQAFFDRCQFEISTSGIPLWLYQG
ncbi:MAG: signal peptide peptidase SppA [Cyanobacteriota bacterium]|nr:signal peptide peptidase SppA [Cyanobacteriota bacterium]